ncbi:MAG TPA: ligand-binding protein SH3 [Candidatus Wolfebacteria bacterium]|nr:ligand-binding protein SH3 [Candidatus Wolfebacteria bacterium]
MSSELLTILMSASPVLELRGAIPTAIFLWDFSASKVYFLSVFGNFLPIIPLLFFWKYISARLSHRIYFFNKFFAWLFEKTRKRHNHHFEIWKGLALILFVAIPLPFTGAWSGTVAAFIFGIPIWKAILMIGTGILISGLIVLLISITGLSLV